MAAKEQKDIGRRYVGTRETVGFVLFDVAQSVKIDTNGEFTDRIVNIDKGIQALVGPFTTTWDIINDVFLAAFVDKTRTRFGKFKPYLVLFPVYGLPMTLLTFFIPFLFWGTDSTFLPKLITWYVIAMLNDISGTIRSIARTGMIANLTPNPQERVLLITKANFFSMLGEDLPRQVFDILRDVISRSAKNTVAEATLNMRNLYFIFGVATILIAGGLSLYFALVSRERVFGAEAQREKPPSVKESVLALRNNRPLLMLMLSELLDGFTLKSQMGTYTKAILNFANFGTIAGAPSSPMSYISYSFVPKLRARFSTKTLWITGSFVTAPFSILIFFFGMIRVKNPIKLRKGITYNFMDLIPMLIVFAVQIAADMCYYGTRKVIPEEIRNECIDYGEWKAGFRSEGMTGALREIPKKVTDIFGNSLTNIVLKAIGFQTGENYTHQTERTAKGVFAMATIVPALMNLVSLAPKLLFNINKKDREIMYVELRDRRAAALAAAEAMHREIEEQGA